MLCVTIRDQLVSTVRFRVHSGRFYSKSGLG